jgi:hypothetical protein
MVRGRLGVLFSGINEVENDARVFRGKLFINNNYVGQSLLGCNAV